jgi:HK97 family phage prohead protease
MSTATVDRGGDVVNQDGWNLKAYKQNPVILWGHDQRIPPIGRAIQIGKRDGSLVSKIEFATAEQHPFAETVFQLVKGGFVNAGSVGFIPIKYNWNEQRRGFDFEEQELLEYSIVGVPMNAEALQQAKSFGLDGDAIDKAFGAFGHLAEAAQKAAEFRAELIAKATPPPRTVYSTTAMQKESATSTPRRPIPTGRQKRSSATGWGRGRGCAPGSQSRPRSCHPTRLRTSKLRSRPASAGSVSSRLTFCIFTAGNRPPINPRCVRRSIPWYSADW